MDKLNQFLEWFNNFGEKDETFESSFYCKNCHNEMTYTFPAGTIISRAPYLGYDSAETRIIIPQENSAALHKTLKCKYCKVGNIA